ncbi:protein PATRONUS 2 isoform X1 [Juglans microcarpa x Juglans regia]|uniref:protein PATRONUS 2 isoform X1 n=1 Tax=Juglans microcarpa x Juglans regia TaxID=2249226 RepID=UPI001B7DDAC3|nr:protein PATRONUS 2 isoform X1 [Juglans microcarpa x Juglans regia]
MASHFTRGQLIIPNENLDFHHKKGILDGKIKSSKTAKKKGGLGHGSRKALNDITNKSSLHHEASSKKMNIPKEELNVAEEMFLHDHRKCIEAQKSSLNTFYLDLILPGQDSVCNAESQEFKQAKTDLDSRRCYPEPVELPISEFSDRLASSTEWTSPPCSPIHWDSPFAWNSEVVEFTLKPEIDV